MSIKLLQSALEELPYALRSQIIGYAESVYNAMPSIEKEIHIKISSNVRDQVVFLAGIRKLYGMVVSSYWALDNSSALLMRSDIDTIQIGGQDYSKDGVYYRKLRNVFDDMVSVVESYDIRHFLELSYSDIVMELMGDGYK